MIRVVGRWTRRLAPWNWLWAIRVRRWARRTVLALVVLLAALAIFITLTPQGRTAFHTALFVSQVLDLPFKPQSWFTAQPVRQQVTYPRAEGTGVADVYRASDEAGGTPRAAVLIFLGANAAGPDDKDVVNLGNALARAGFVTMFHWSPTMALRHNIDPNEIENLVRAFQFLSDQDFVDPQRVGLGGFCVGASFALVAAADARIRDNVVFVNAFGPYYDGRDLLLQLATRSRFFDDRREPWQPDQLTLRVFANELIETLQDPRDKQLMTRLFLEGAAVPEEARAGLSNQAQQIRKLLEGTSLGEAERVYQALPSGFRQDMERISPSAHLPDLKARVAIMHDRNDRLVPSVESRRLYQAMESRGDVRYTEVVAFDHVRPSAGGLWQAAQEGFRLYRHMYSIIREAR